jgi:hypothetical protein
MGVEKEGFGMGEWRMICENSLCGCSTVSIQEVPKLTLKLLYDGVTQCLWLSIWALTVMLVFMLRVKT